MIKYGFFMLHFIWQWVDNDWTTKLKSNLFFLVNLVINFVYFVVKNVSKMAIKYENYKELVFQI